MISERLRKIYQVSYKGDLYHLYFGINDIGTLGPFETGDFESDFRDRVTKANIDAHIVSCDHQGRGWIFLLENPKETMRICTLLQELFSRRFSKGSYLAIVIRSAVEVIEVSQRRLPLFRSDTIPLLQSIRSQNVDFGKGSIFACASLIESDFSDQYVFDEEVGLGAVSLRISRR